MDDRDPPACEPGSPSSSGMMRGSDRITRSRYLELAQMAKGLCDQLEKMGVTRHEGCQLRSLTETLWNL